MINPHRPQTTPKFPYIHWAGWPFHLRRVKRIRHIQLHRPRFIYTRVSSSNRVSPFRCLVVVVVVSIAAAVVYSQPNASIQTIEIPTYSIFFFTVHRRHRRRHRRCRSLVFDYFDWANNIFHRRALTLSNYSDRLGSATVLWLAFFISWALNANGVRKRCAWFRMLLCYVLR